MFTMLQQQPTPGHTSMLINQSIASLRPASCWFTFFLSCPHIPFTLLAWISAHTWSSSMQRFGSFTVPVTSGALTSSTSSSDESETCSGSSLFKISVPTGELSPTLLPLRSFLSQCCLPAADTKVSVALCFFLVTH